jgi:hypothetical protein
VNFRQIQETTTPKSQDVDRPDVSRSFGQTRRGQTRFTSWPEESKITLKLCNEPFIIKIADEIILENIVNLLTKCIE